MSAVIAALLGGFFAAGADPMLTTYSWLVALGTAAIIAVLIATSLSVVAFFARTDVDKRTWNTRIAPGLASFGFAAAGYLAVANYTTLLGGQGGVARWLLVLIPAAAMAGWLLASVRLRRGHSLDYTAKLGG